MSNDPPPAGTLLAVSVGLPKDVPWHGRTVHTGVWKYPVPGPHRLRTLNLDGDGQGDLAGHGGPNRAVLVYQLDSYEHWRTELGLGDFEYGQFGENFTVEGLSDDEVCIGDRYEIGTALVEVSQPRVTCYRVAMRLGVPELPSLLVAHRRPGFYLRVLREGVVEAGDPIVKVASAPDPMSVAAVDALLYLPGHGRADVARALQQPALSPGWQGSFRAILDTGTAGGNAGLAAAGPPPAWRGFRPARVVDIVRESDTVVSVRLAAADGEPLPAALPGQFVALGLRTGSGRPTVRSYSLSGPPGTGDYRVSVKREPHGVGSGYVHDGLAAGATVDLAAPRGTFTLDDSTDPVVLASAGIGVTPVLAMLYALAAQRSGREVWWLHGARNGAEHPFATAAAALLGALPKAHALVCYSAPLPSDEAGRDFDVRGHLDGTVLASLSLPVDAVAYLCGPTAFMAGVRADLTRSGLDAARVHTEVFGAGPAQTPGIAAAPVRSPHPPAGEPGTGAEVVFSRSGLTVPWRPDFGSLLEFAEACDVPVRWSCRTGVCHTCESGLLAGAVTYEPEPVDPPGPGDALICCSRPTADVVLDL